VEPVCGEGVCAIVLPVASGVLILLGVCVSASDCSSDGSVLRVVPSSARSDAMGAIIIELGGDRSDSAIG
jgi:hypothetical protein